MTPIQNMIARHAYIKAGVSRDYQAGKRTPTKILNELQAIETKAQAMFTPHELQQAMTASSSMQAQYLQQHDQQAAHLQSRDRGYYTEKLTKDLTGLTPNQLLRVKQGKAIPVKGKGQKLNSMKGNVEKMFKASGINTTFDAVNKASTRVEEIKANGGDPTDYLKSKYGKHYKQAEQLLGAFEGSGIGYEAGLIKPEPDHFEKPTEELIRRSEIADAWASTAMTSEENFKSIAASDIDESYFEGDRGDIARAFVKHEAESDAQERSQWSAPDYNIQDDEDGELEYATL